MIGEAKLQVSSSLKAGHDIFMKELQISNLEDIIAGISLYRRSMDQIPGIFRTKKSR